MQVNELKARQGNVEILLEIVDRESPREFEKFGKSGKVCNCKAKDDTGTIKLTLWNDDVEKVKVGDKVKITNGWVGEWQGELQLSTGKFGTIEVVGVADETMDEAVEEDVLDNLPQSDDGEHVLTDDERTEEEVDEAFGEDVLEDPEKETE